MATENKGVNVNFRVTEELRDKLSNLAKARGMTTSKLLRAYMEELVYGNKTQKAGITRTESATKNDYMIGIRCTEEQHKQFFDVCEKNGQMPTKILRAFLIDYTRLMSASRETVPFESTLAYLGIFLQNEMMKQGFAIMNHDDMTMIRGSGDYPVIKEITTNDSCIRMYELYDAENKIRYTMIFRRVSPPSI